MPRLIDADILAESSCYGVCQECDDMYKGKNITTNCSEIRLKFLRLINDAPTVDAEPVRQGHWIEIHEVFDYIKCSECGEDWCAEDNDTETFNYCPNCGAKMDGERREDD